MFCDFTILPRDSSNIEDEKNVKILNAPVHIGQRAKKEDEKTIEQNSIWIKQNEDVSLVSKN